MGIKSRLFVKGEGFSRRAPSLLPFGRRVGDEGGDGRRYRGGSIGRGQRLRHAGNRSAPLKAAFRSREKAHHYRMRAMKKTPEIGRYLDDEEKSLVQAFETGDAPRATPSANARSRRWRARR